MNRYIRSLSDVLGDDLKKVSLEKYLEDDFALLYVASGGSEGYFIEVFDQLKDRPCYILTSGDSNSLAASMEILSFLNQHGGKGEILHGDVDAIAARIKSLKAAHKAKASLRGKNLGVIGTPSDWLIASSYSPEAMKEKLGIGFVTIPMEEFLGEIGKKQYEPNPWTEELLAKDFDRSEVTKALEVYGATKRICEKYNLAGVSIRCFDLLDTVRSTGCLALAILNAEGIYGGCEGDIPALLSMAILGSVSEQPCFLCNPSRFDTKNGIGVFAHCTLPLNMLKEYTLNTHFESGIGVAIQGRFEENACTVFKCAGDVGRYYAQEGTVEEFPFTETLCRTQVKVHLANFSYFLTNPINNHHIICYGRHAKALEDFFSIL